MYRKRRGFVGNGYTLLEALYHLFVFFLFSQIVVFIFLWITKQNELYFTNEQTTWEMFVSDFQTFLINIEEITVNDRNNKLEIKYAHQPDKIQISPINEVLRKQVNNSGHVPLLIGINYLFFELEENQLKIVVKFLNGIIKERTFIVQTIEK